MQLVLTLQFCKFSMNYYNLTSKFILQLNKFSTLQSFINPNKMLEQIQKNAFIWKMHINSIGT